MAGICKVLVGNGVRPIWGPRASSLLAKEPQATSLPKRRDDPPLALPGRPSQAGPCACRSGCLFKGLPLPLSPLPPTSVAAAAVVQSCMGRCCCRSGFLVSGRCHHFPPPPPPSPSR